VKVELLKQAEEIKKQEFARIEFEKAERENLLPCLKKNSNSKPPASKKLFVSPSF
jgi:hypothetical protein